MIESDNQNRASVAGEAASQAAPAGGRLPWRLRREELFGSMHHSEVKGALVRGATVTMLAQLARLVLQTAAMMIIARVLTPEDFGLQGEVVAVTGFICLFRDAGLSMATIQRPEITHEETSTLFWINVALGAVLMLITTALAPLLVYLFNEPRLFWMTIISGSMFFVNGLCVQHQALLQRTLKFTTLAQIDLLGLVVSMAVGVGLALGGFGYWSLVWMALAAPLVTLAFVWAKIGWLPGRPREVRKVASHLLFGGTFTLNMLLVYLAYYVSPAFILGRWHGVEAVGLFTRAYQLINIPMQQLNDSVFKVAFPALSRIQHDTALLCRSFLKGYSIQLALNVPITVCTVLFAKEIVRVLLGPQWPAAVRVLELLTPAILCFALINPLGWFMIATGRAMRSLRIAFVLVPVVILGIALGARHGAVGVAVGFSAAIVALTFPIVVWALHGSGITLREYFMTISRPLLAGLAAAAVAWFVKVQLSSVMADDPKWQAVLILFGGSAVMCAVYAFILLIVMNQKPVYWDLAKQVIERRRGNAGAA